MSFFIGCPNSTSLNREKENSELEISLVLDADGIGNNNNCSDEDLSGLKVYTRFERYSADYRGELAFSGEGFIGWSFRYIEDRSTSDSKIDYTTYTLEFMPSGKYISASQYAYGTLSPGGTIYSSTPTGEEGFYTVKKENGNYSLFLYNKDKKFLRSYYYYVSTEFLCLSESPLNLSTE